MADNSDHLTAISSFLLDSPNTHSAFSENFTTGADALLAPFDNTKDKEGEATVPLVDTHILSPSTYELINKDVRVGVGRKIGFKIQSDLEILDDGFKWRKYGKKSVKTNPNPRNYYHCSSDGCRVKKTVERDPDDPRFVKIVYDGVHNHSSFNRQSK